MAEQTRWQRVQETGERVSVMALGVAAAVGVLLFLWAGLAYSVSIDRLDSGVLARAAGVVLDSIGAWRRR